MRAEEVSQVRVLLASALTFVGLVITLLLLTAGTQQNYLQNAAFSIIPVPNNASHELRALGQFDWVSLHFLCVNAGNYDHDTGQRMNITISKDPKLRQVFEAAATYRKVPLIFHGLALGCAGLAFVSLPPFFGGRRHHNGYPTMLLTISWAFLCVSGVSITSDRLSQVNDPRASTGIAIPLHWVAVVFIIMASMLEMFEYLLQRMTEEDKRITIRNFQPSALLRKRSSRDTERTALSRQSLEYRIVSIRDFEPTLGEPMSPTISTPPPIMAPRNMRIKTPEGVVKYSYRPTRTPPVGEAIDMDQRRESSYQQNSHLFGPRPISSIPEQGVIGAQLCNGQCSAT
ncbi:hypothetical protein BT63DRAFT_414280 [Microthyrium microscopicum]|uniref:Pali-domain-containing protein n=1 Tax=Microthyrium microscopicum TaxID=703497 RepID=A0A6A6U7X2_9PEZI|nr:hypothetical protein BT63DRAFT_414280 [Microthyrium microscopicum]